MDNLLTTYIATVITVYIFVHKFKHHLILSNVNTLIESGECDDDITGAITRVLIGRIL